MLLSGSSLDFIVPKFFDTIIPPILPGRPRTWIYVSWTIALAIEIGLSIPLTGESPLALQVCFSSRSCPPRFRWQWLVA